MSPDSIKSLGFFRYNCTIPGQVQLANGSSVDQQGNIIATYQMLKPYDEVNKESQINPYISTILVFCLIFAFLFLVCTGLFVSAMTGALCFKGRKLVVPAEQVRDPHPKDLSTVENLVVYTRHSRLESKTEIPSPKPMHLS
jgi:hypothetical protein